MSRLTSLFSIGLFFLTFCLPAFGQDPNPQSGDAASQPLSPQSMDALTAGIALYPDQTVQEALAAATNPQAIEAAAALTPEQFQAQSNQFDPSIQYLQANAPELLQQFDQHLSLTTTLGIAAKTQLNDVWASVDRVRAQYQQSTSQNQNTNNDSSTATGNEASEETAPTYNTYVDNSTTTTGYGTTGYGAGAFAAGLVAGNAWQNLYRGRPYYPAYNRYPANNNFYHNGNNVIGNNVIDDRHPADNRVGGVGGVTGVGGVSGIGGVGGAGGVTGIGGINTARPADVKAGNNDWVNGIGAGERQNLATNTWGHMDNQAHESFTGRNGSAANFNEGPDTARPGSNTGFGRPEGAESSFGDLNSLKFNGGFDPSQGKLSPTNSAKQLNGLSPNRNPTPSRSFGGPSGGSRGGAGGRAGGGRR